MENKHHAHRVMLAILVGIIAVPLTSTALFINQESLKDRVDLDAFEDRRRVRAQTRLYWHAIDVYQDKLEKGIDVEKPDFNDPESFGKVHSAAPDVEEEVEAPSTVSSLTTDQLKSQDRMLLRRYTRAGFCPDVLENFRIPGFLDLCNSLVGLRVKNEPVTGLLNHNAYLRQAIKAAAPKLDPFRLRMKMMDEALHGSRRDGGQRHLRPTVCVMNEDCLNPRYSD